MAISVTISFITHGRTGFSLAWNMFLSFVPLVLSTLILLLGAKRPLAVTLISIPWILFLPNSFYVMTDLMHLSGVKFFAPHDNLDSHLTLFVIFSGAVLGMFAGTMSLRDFHQLLRQKGLSRATICGILAIIFVLLGYGLYMGRFLRLNSWDVINPVKIIDALIRDLSPFTLQMSALYTVYVALAYCFYTKVIRR